MRKIIHVDADCFFAAVEMRDSPKLRHIPIAVGGSSSRRGVISTCNYLARSFGVHSAMPTAYALRLCPHLTLLPHRFDAYRDASLAMRQIFEDYTDLIEPLSLDEAYLDVSHSGLYQGSATRIAQEIRRRVEAEVGITVSAGVASNKFLAKVASDWEKPNGLTVVTPQQADAFSAKLPIKCLRGVGKVTADKMKVMGLETCADIRQLGLEPLVKRFGSFGHRMYECAYGRDDRPVTCSRERKSLSVERTFGEDLTRAESQARLSKVTDELRRRVADKSLTSRVHKAFVKVKFADFTSTTLERVGTATSDIVYQRLFNIAATRSQQAIRLLGAGVRLKPADPCEQLLLF